MFSPLQGFPDQEAEEHCGKSHTCKTGYNVQDLASSFAGAQAVYSSGSREDWGFKQEAACQWPWMLQ